MQEFSYYILILGLIIVLMTLLRSIGQKMRQNVIREKDREAAIKAAKEAERKLQTEAPIPSAKTVQPQSRIPLAANPLGTPFVGGIRGNAARWEAELFQLGRQIISQIDSKMAALQALTIDANRTANRLEILVEHLEQIARKEGARRQAIEERRDEGNIQPPDAPQVPLTAVLQELAEDMDGVHQKIKQSTVFQEKPTAAVLRIEELQAKSIRSEVEMLTNYGVDPMEIAERLNISIGEVDLILQAQGA